MSAIVHLYILPACLILTILNVPQMYYCWFVTREGRLRPENIENSYRKIIHIMTRHIMHIK